MKIPKEYRKIARVAMDQGWSLSCTRSNHIRWDSPEGKAVFSPSTPSDHRSLQNVIRKLKYRGLKI